MGVIEHTATVLALGDSWVEVGVEQQAACEACKARSVCQGGGEDKRIVVETPAAGYFNVGETVMVAIGRSMGMKAVVVAYIVPFFVMFAVLLACLGLDLGEVASGLSSLGAVAVYYIALALSRKRIEREINFAIRKIDE